MDHSDTWYPSTIDDMHNIHASTSQYKIQLNTWITNNINSSTLQNYPIGKHLKFDEMVVNDLQNSYVMAKLRHRSGGPFVTLLSGRKI